MAIVSMLYGAGGASSADEVSYDNTTSGLEAENVQDAIDEVNDNLGNVRFGINGDGSYGYYKADDSFVPFSKSFYQAQLYTCGNILPNRLSVGNIGSYFTYDWEGSSEANNPSLCRITLNKRMKARVTFSITGRLAAQAVRRIFKHNTETLYDKTISENDFVVEKPGGIVLEDTFEQGDYFIIGVSYYTTAFKGVILNIDLI